ncbi:MAG TPA: S8 family serine peptidase [Acidimicrobiales bacterium]|nr:S8 family serine peptidase [Acidimicrobiales bacterium]
MGDPTGQGGQRWYLERQGHRFGPFTWHQLEEMAASGRIGPDDVLWVEGAATSQRAASIPGLLPRADRTVPFVIAGVLAALALVAGLVVATRDGDGTDVGTGPQATAADETAGASGADPDDVGVVEIVAPAAEPLRLDDGGAVAADQVLVIAGGADADQIASAAAAAVGGAVVGRVELAALFQIRIDPTDHAGIDAAVATAAAVPGVELAFPNGTAQLDEEIWGVRESPMDDPVYADGRGGALQLVGAPQAWEYLRGSGLQLHPVHVGVTDDGLYRGPDHALSEFPSAEDGPGVRVRFPDPAAGERATPRVRDGVPDPGGSHGTGVMTTLAGDPDNGGAVGVAGPLRSNLTISRTDVFSPPYGNSGFTVVAPDPDDDAQIVWDDGVSYTTGNFAAIAGQIADGARVINMSWGCTNCDAATARAHRLFFERMAERHPDVLFVASAGNDSQAIDGSRRYPSGLALPNMITVGSVNTDGATTSYSNRANATEGQQFEVTLAAPGHQAVRGVGPDGAVIATDGGTSNAAPQVTAAAALLLAVNPDLTAAEIKAILTETARTTVRIGDDDVAIDQGVGGRVLAVDEAVRRVIAERLGRPLSEITPELLEQLSIIDAVAVRGEDDAWTVTGYVQACREGCTDVAISVSGDHALSGAPSQRLAAAGDVSWSVSVLDYPTWIVVRRSDTGAASRITLDPIDLNGIWNGSATITSLSGVDADTGEVVPLPPDALADEGCDLADVIGLILVLRLDVVADVGGGGQVTVTVTPPTETGQAAESLTVPLSWSGSSLSFAIEGGEWRGTAVRRPNGEVGLTGTFSMGSEDIIAAGTWGATQQGP